MAGSYGGAVKLTGESAYTQGIKRMTQVMKEMSSEMKAVTASYDKNDNSISALDAKQKVLNKTLDTAQKLYTETKKKVDDLTTQYNEQEKKHKELQKTYDTEKKNLQDIKAKYGETSKEYKNQVKLVDELQKELTKSTNAQNQNTIALSKAKTEMNNAEASYKKTSKEVDDLTKEIKDAENPLNQFKNAIKASGDEAEKASNDGFTVFKGMLANLGTQVVNTAITGIKKLGTALANVGKQAIESYADYEQLVGGVETLFKDSASIVQKYAANAYKTAGLSANQYMETVTSFSASLLQGLKGDTEKAAKYADMAIIDMSDNANKMGTSMEMIQNAYQGFAKQNYTMLDNLKLGYGGTKSEMARLVKESGVLGNAGKDLTAKNLDQKVSYDKIVEAIHKVQENMGITGTTSKEAASTISGSVNSMKAAWSNLLTAIADDNQDLSKSVDKLVDSAVTAAKNIVPRIKVSVDGIKKLINSIVKEVFPKLKKEIPELKPLIQTFEWFIKNKSLVVGAVKAMVTAFALNKILTFTKGLTNTAKALIEVAKGTAMATTATNLNTAAEATNTAGKVAATGATGALTAATNLLNAAWKSNPIGIVVTAISGLVGVFGILKSKTDEATEAQNAQSKAFEEAAEKAKEANAAYDDLRKTQQNTVDAGMTEITHYKSLYDELQGIVDQNGKVKKGYEERASFITSTLSEALGIEIKNVDGVITNYKKLKSTIDEVMEKKKAQIILDSQETLYKEAINGQTEALKNYTVAQQQLNTKKSERKKLEDELIAKQQEYDNKVKELGTANKITGDLKKEIASIKEKMETNDKDTANIQKNYDQQTELLSKYAYDIGVYESNMAAAHAGEYDKMTNINWKYIKDYQKAGDAEKAQLQDQIKLTEANLNILKNLKEKSGSDIYDQQIKDAEKQLEEHKNSLKQYEIATIKGLDATKIDWENGLSNQLSAITGKKIKFKETGKDQVQMYVDGVAEGKPKAKQEMADLINQTIDEINKKDGDAKKAGENLIDGVNNGVKNQNKQNSVFSSISNFGNNLLQRLKNSLKEKSPSKATKEMGQYLLEGLGIGIESEEGNILSQIGNVGKNVISTLQDELNQNVKLGNIQANVNSSVIRDPNNISNYDNLVGAFKDALSDMEVVMDDEVMGKFIDKTVARTIYS